MGAIKWEDEHEEGEGVCQDIWEDECVGRGGWKCVSRVPGSQNGRMSVRGEWVSSWEDDG